MTFPAPHPRETIASCSYRIAKLSGLSGLSELAHLFDLDLRALLMGDHLSLKRLAEYTGCDPQMLANGTLDARNPHRLQLGADRTDRTMAGKPAHQAGTLSHREA